MLLKLYDKNNNPQDLQRIIDILNDGGLIIYPTDTMYAIGCHGLKERAIERICRIKEIDPRKNLSLIHIYTTDKINYSIINCSRSLCIRIKQIKIRSKIKKIFTHNSA